MTGANTEASGCERIKSLLDLHPGNRLALDSDPDLKRHLETCQPCAQMLAEREWTRQALQRALLKEEAPAELRARIQRQIRATPQSSSMWMLAAAASILLSLGGYFLIDWLRGRATVGSDPEVASVMQIGLDDHIHCALGTWYEKREFNDQMMSAALGPQFADLAPLVKSVLPPDLRLLVAHQCQVGERNFVHLILRRDERRISLVIAGKEGEGYPEGGATALPSGVNLHEAQMQRFQLAGFETRSHLVYFISDLERMENLQLAVALATPVRDFLARLDS